MRASVIAPLLIVWRRDRTVGYGKPRPSSDSLTRLGPFRGEPRVGSGSPLLGSVGVEEQVGMVDGWEPRHRENLRHRGLVQLERKPA
jgi:hypothetical protein